MKKKSKGEKKKENRENVMSVFWIQTNGLDSNKILSLAAKRR